MTENHEAAGEVTLKQHGIQGETVRGLDALLHQGKDAILLGEWHWVK